MMHNIQMNQPAYDFEYGPYQANSLLKDCSFQVRRGFVQKVYSIITCQLFATGFLSFYAMMTTDVGFGHFLRTSPWTLWLMMAINFVTMLVVLCFRNLSRTYPKNYIYLGIFTFTEAWMVAFICAWYQQQGLADIVLMAVFMTAGMTLALTLYAFNTETDITMKGGSLFVFGCAIFLFSLFEMISRSPTYHILVSVGVITLYGFYLIYDTQLITGGKSHELSIDDYILASMMIYIDIIVIFLRILKILTLIMKKDRQ